MTYAYKRQYLFLLILLTVLIAGTVSAFLIWNWAVAATVVVTVYAITIVGMAIYYLMRSTSNDKSIFLPTVAQDIEMAALLVTNRDTTIDTMAMNQFYQALVTTEQDALSESKNVTPMTDAEKNAALAEYSRWITTMNRTKQIYILCLTKCSLFSAN